MKKEEIINLIKSDGYTENQTNTIYNEMNCSTMTSETEIMNVLCEFENNAINTRFIG